MMKREKEMAALLAGPCQMTAFFPEMLTPCGLCAMGFSCPHERNKRGDSDAWQRSYAAMLSLQLTVKSTTHGRFPFPLCAPQPSLPHSPSHISFPFLSTDPTGSSPSLSMDPGGIQTGAPPPPRAASPSSLKPRSPSLLEPALNP